jgi:hypothetical protein
MRLGFLVHLYKNYFGNLKKGIRSKAKYTKQNKLQFIDYQYFSI